MSCGRAEPSARRATLRSSLTGGTPARRGGRISRLAGPLGEREGMRPYGPSPARAFPGGTGCRPCRYPRQARAIMSAALSACAAATKSAFPSSLSRDAHEER